MKKTAMVITLAAVWLAAPLFCGLNTDITGTWVGQTEVQDMPEPVEVKMVIEKTDDGYSITASDSMEMIQPDSVENIEFKDGKLTYTFNVFNGEVYLDVYMSLTVDGNTMKGYWETDDGTSGPIEFEKE